MPGLHSLDALFPSGPPKLNHIAISLPAAALDRAGRRAIKAFYGEVFGWREVPSMTVDRERLVLSTTGFDQFIYLCADERPMTAPRMDHFGVSVGDLAELQGIFDRASALRERDPEVQLVAPSVEHHEVVTVHNMYVGYALPMMIEVQYWEVVVQPSGDSTTDATATEVTA